MTSMCRCRKPLQTCTYSSSRLLLSRRIKPEPKSPPWNQDSPSWKDHPELLLHRHDVTGPNTASSSTAAAIVVQVRSRARASPSMEISSVFAHLVLLLLHIYDLTPTLLNSQKHPLELAPGLLIVQFNPTESFEFAALMPDFLLTSDWTQNFQKIQFDPRISSQTSNCALHTLWYANIDANAT